MRDDERRRQGDQIADAAHDHSFFAGEAGGFGAEGLSGIERGLAAARQQVQRANQPMAPHFTDRGVAGERPVVILSHDIFNERSGTVIAIAVSSQESRAGFPLTLEITTARLPKRSWARISQIRTLSIERLGKKLAHVAPEELERMVEGLNEIIAG